MKEQCTWDSFQPSDINFCEEKLCAWIVKPAETWSNLSYVLAGLFVIYLSRKENRKDLTLIGWIGIVLGIFSGFYHASGTRIGGWLDITSMYLFTGLGIALNLKRLKGTKLLPVFLAVVLPSSIGPYFLQVLGIVIFGLQFTLAFALEYLIHKRSRTPADYTQIKITFGVFALAWAVWWLDLTKVWCDPANHYFSGHALWHLLTGATFYFIYRFYSQFDGKTLSDSK